MLFSSAAFLYSFLPLTIAVYFLMPRRLKNAALLLMSLIFYAWGEPRYAILMLLSVTQGYIFARLMGKSRGTKKAKAYLIISLVLSLGMLGVFKYANFFAESFAAVFGLKIAALNIALPIGISFYTFQLISYVIDVYRADVEPQRDYVAFAAYISMFPQLIAGPIVRYSDIEAELTARAYGADKAAYGARRFILGLGKKVLIANVLAELVNAFKASGEKSTLFYWVYAAAYMLHVYFDFSGYSDMAIGLGAIFGFTFPENFNYPYIAASITEFWRRWHMSLSSWFLVSILSLAALSSSAWALASLTIRSISASERPLEAVIVIFCSLPVPRSFAVTCRMPFASMSNVTSICGTPRGAGAMPSSLNRPIAFVVFLVVKAMNTAKAKLEKPAEPEPEKAPEPTKEELLLTEIRDLLKNK
mgnify:CR=1 FL=1